MMTFLLYTIIMWIAGNCILRLFYAMIQKEQLLDQVFNWQIMLEKLYASEKRWKNNLGKALGDCQMCVSFWFMPLWYIAYLAMGVAFDIWMITGWWNILWYVVFHSIGAISGLTMLLKRKRHVV